MAKTYQNGVLKFKDRDGNSGELWGFSKKEREDTLAAVPQVQKNKEDIAKIKQVFPNIDAGGGTLTPIDLTKFAKKEEANTFTQANTFNQNITMSVVQDNVDNIEDQHLVTGKALKAVKAAAGGKEVIRFVEQAPEVGAMDANVLYFFPVPTTPAIPQECKSWQIP